MEKSRPNMRILKAFSILLKLTKWKEVSSATSQLKQRRRKTYPKPENQVKVLCQKKYDGIDIIKYIGGGIVSLQRF